MTKGFAKLIKEGEQVGDLLLWFWSAILVAVRQPYMYILAAMFVGGGALVGRLTNFHIVKTILVSIVLFIVLYFLLSYGAWLVFVNQN